jgi:hypothetical protein
LNFFRKPSNNTFWKIPTENSVGDSLCNWHDEQCSQFTDRITEGIYRQNFPSVKMTRHLFFCFFFKFFSHGNSVGIYRGNISVGKIPRKFTDENIPSVFPFVFINFLVVWICKICSLLFLCLVMLFCHLFALDCFPVPKRKKI